MHSATIVKEEKCCDFFNNIHVLTSGNGGLDIIVPVAFCRALICRSARNGARHIGQLFAWYLKESAHPLHKHKCLHGRINVSRTSHMQMTHSEPLSSVSSSLPCCCASKEEIKTQIGREHEEGTSPKYFLVPLRSQCFYFRFHISPVTNNIGRRRKVSV